MESSKIIAKPKKKKKYNETGGTIGSAAGGVLGYDIAGKVGGKRGIAARMALGAAIATGGYFLGRGRGKIERSK